MALNLLIRVHENIPIVVSRFGPQKRFILTLRKRFHFPENVMNNAAGTIVATSDDEDEGDESFEEGSADRLLVF